MAFELGMTRDALPRPADRSRSPPPSRRSSSRTSACPSSSRDVRLRVPMNARTERASPVSSSRSPARRCPSAAAAQSKSDAFAGKIPPVSGQLYRKAGRFEVTATGNLSLNDAFFTKYFGGAEARLPLHRAPLRRGARDRRRRGEDQLGGGLLRDARLRRRDRRSCSGRCPAGSAGSSARRSPGRRCTASSTCSPSRWPTSTCRSSPARTSSRTTRCSRRTSRSSGRPGSRRASAGTSGSGCASSSRSRSPPGSR